MEVGGYDGCGVCGGVLGGGVVVDGVVGGDEGGDDFDGVAPGDEAGGAFEKEDEGDVEGEVQEGPGVVGGWGDGRRWVMAAGVLFGGLGVEVECVDEVLDRSAFMSA